METRLSVLLYAGLLLLSPYSKALAQATASATIQGTVLDQTKAVLPGASVTVVNNTTGLTRSTLSNALGLYRFDLLPAGTYDLRAEAPGFAGARADNLEAFVERTMTVDLTLPAGAAPEQITVVEGSALDLEKSSVSFNITPTQVRDLPLNGRDFANLAVLSPGAKPVDSYDPTKNRISIFGVNGSSGRNVNVTVNGIDNKDNTVGGPVMQLPLEGIQEFAISTQRFSAANGRTEGAAVNVVMKRGENDFHGSAFFLERNERLNANDYFSKQSDQPKSPFSRQQFGGSVGGPIRQNKDFFFFALERQRENTNVVANPDAVKELEIVRSLGANPAANIPTPYRDWRHTTRIDHALNNAHNLFFTFNGQTNRGENDQSGSNNDLTAGNFTKNELQLANLTLASTLNPRTVNTFTSGYQYWNNLIDPKKSATTVFFPGNIYFGANQDLPQQSYQQKWQFRDDFYTMRGRHALKMGVDHVYEPKLGGFFDENPTLRIDFLDLPSVITTDKAKYPQGFSTAGAVTGMTIGAGDPYFDLPHGAKMLGFYFQDDWKVARRFALNLGMRWDKDFGLVGTESQAKNRTYLQLKAINNVAARALPQDDNHNFSPRFGFAWDLSGNNRHVIRGGYGIYFGQIFLNIPLYMIQQANPTLFAAVLSLSSSGPGDTRSDVVPGTNKRLSDWRFNVDPLPVVAAAPTQFSGGEVGRIMDPDYRNPYSQQWNIGYAFELDSASVIEADYIHELGLRESKTVNINPRRPTQAGRDMDPMFQAAGLPLLGPINVESSVGRSRYDGLNIEYRRRMSRHLSVNSHYVLSRSLAYNGHAAEFKNRATDVDNIFAKHDLGPTPNDERHRLVVSGLVELPAGFQLAPIMQWASARPYDAIQGIDVFDWGTEVGSAHVILSKDRPGDLTLTRDWTATQLRSCLSAGQCYEAQYDLLRGQPFYQLDLRVSKELRFGDMPRLRLIFQAFDLTNRANFGNNYVGDVRNTNFRSPNGFITSSGVTVPRSFSGEVGAQFIF
jgi:hypothetical protein